MDWAPALTEYGTFTPSDPDRIHTVFAFNPLVEWWSLKWMDGGSSHLNVFSSFNNVLEWSVRHTTVSHPSNHPPHFDCSFRYTLPHVYAPSMKPKSTFAHGHVEVHVAKLLLSTLVGFNVDFYHLCFQTGGSSRWGVRENMLDYLCLRGFCVTHTHQNVCVCRGICTSDLFVCTQSQLQAPSVTAFVLIYGSKSVQANSQANSH